MENFEIKNEYEKIIGNYIDEHPNSMSIIIREIDDDNYKVLYANSIALQYFSGEIDMSATVFFGDFWHKLNCELGNLTMNLTREADLEMNCNDERKLFELILRKSKVETEQKVVFIELKEQTDLLFERELRMELQHKYSSVINHNLDPIISINKRLEITSVNSAVQSTFGYNKKNVLGSSIFNFIKKNHSEQLGEFIERGFLGKSIEMEGLSFSHDNGSYMRTHIKTLPVVVEDTISEIHLIVRDTSENHKNNEKLLFLSYHDHLTGLWNRRALKENFIEKSVVVKENNKTLSFIHLGLDRFKLIVDSLGHNGADEILKKTAERLKFIANGIGVLYRKGGDEFIITMEQTSVDETEIIAQKILGEFTKPFYFDHQEYFISASIGISVFPKDGKTAEELMRKSAQALFYVKEHGRSHYRFYEEVMNNLFHDEVLMESHLRRAIELDELKVYYQPQVNLKTGNITSFEALLRWNNKEFGFVPPSQFIRIAEESGLIHNIGDWVLDQVCKQLKEWQDKSYRKVRIAVNISPKQFRMGNFSDRVREKIDKYGIDSSSLEVEITENALAYMNKTLETLNALKKIGIFISVDDFGTGYSSLSYLKQYPIDIIKIDRSFIHDIEIDEKNKAIAKTIINLAHNLGMEVIAEGVEKDLQAEILLDANCHKAQGFLYSKAVPVEEIDKYFGTSV